jgi:glycosyltransferase involved in cell wall biosynthesis
LKILILSQYFPPETGAPQNRLYSLALNLAEQGGTVNILTAMPNYPKMEVFPDYKGRFYMRETDGPLTIFRTWIFVKKSRQVVPRLLNYFSFVFSSLLVGLLIIKKQDIILCESPPIFLGLTALVLKRIKRAKLVFNVSDLWPETAEKLGIIKNKILLKAAYRLEESIYRKSALVSGQTQGIIKNIKNRFPRVNTYWLRNGIDFEQYNINSDGDAFRVAMNLSRSDFILVYAGVFGHAQGLETVIETAEELMTQKNIKFFLVGDGPERDNLIQLTQDKRLQNLFFLPNKPRNEIPGIIAACDAYIVPLKKNDLFLGAIPSKLFEPLAMRKPIILGVDGEARDLFIENGKCGLYFEPENSVELAHCISVLFNDKALAKQMGENGGHYVRQYFDRRVIAHEFNNELIKITDKTAT